MLEGKLSGRRCIRRAGQSQWTVYNLSEVDSTIDGPRSVNYFGFDEGERRGRAKPRLVPPPIGRLSYCLFRRRADFQRNNPCSYRAAIDALVIVDRKVRAIWMQLDNSEPYWLAAFRAVVVDGKAHGEFLFASRRTEDTQSTT
jgi:hypothetical protein